MDLCIPTDLTAGAAAIRSAFESDLIMSESAGIKKTDSPRMEVYLPELKQDSKDALNRCGFSNKGCFSNFVYKTVLRVNKKYYY